MAGSRTQCAGCDGSHTVLTSLRRTWFHLAYEVPLFLAFALQLAANADVGEGDRDKIVGVYRSITLGCNKLELWGQQRDSSGKLIAVRQLSGHGTRCSELTAGLAIKSFPVEDLMIDPEGRLRRIFKSTADRNLTNFANGLNLLCSELLANAGGMKDFETVWCEVAAPPPTQVIARSAYNAAVHERLPIGKNECGTGADRQLQDLLPPDKSKWLDATMTWETVRNELEFNGFVSLDARQECFRPMPFVAISPNYDVFMVHDPTFYVNDPSGQICVRDAVANTIVVPLLH